MTTPELRDPEYYKSGSVKHHLAAAVSWADAAGSLYDDEANDDTTAGWTALHTQATSAAALATAHAAIAQAKIAAGWPIA